MSEENLFSKYKEGQIVRFIKSVAPTENAQRGIIIGATTTYRTNPLGGLPYPALDYIIEVPNSDTNKDDLKAHEIYTVCEAMILGLDSTENRKQRQLVRTAKVIVGDVGHDGLTQFCDVVSKLFSIHLEEWILHHHKTAVTLHDVAGIAHYVI